MIDHGARTNAGDTSHSVDIHPAKRWAALLRLALTCTHDVTTVRAWAREAGMCETQLRLRCRRAGVPAKRSLDFGRSLRAVLWREIHGGAIKDYLDVADDRTIRRLFARMGLSGRDDATLLRSEERRVGKEGGSRWSAEGATSNGVTA